LNQLASFASLSSHRAIALTTCFRSSSVSSRPRGMRCHFSRHPRQHVAVACCATKTGCPLNGVCFPSLTGDAGARRRNTKSDACSRTVFKPFRRRYSSSFAPSEKFRRNADPSRAVKTSRRSLKSGRDYWIETTSTLNTSTELPGIGP
jgi:hypothetical protein